MSDFIATYQQDFQKALNYLQKEFGMIQAGRANPVILDDVIIDVYESKMKIHELATITVPEPRVLHIAPWDKAIIKNIISGLKDAKLDLQIIADGGGVRLIVPDLTEESRKAMVKKVSDKIEKSKINIRQVRDKVKEEILKSEKNKEISQDEKFSFLKELDDVVHKHIKTIDESGTKKKEEMMTV